MEVDAFQFIKMVWIEYEIGEEKRSWRKKGIGLLTLDSLLAGRKRSER